MAKRKYNIQNLKSGGHPGAHKFTRQEQSLGGKNCATAKLRRRDMRTLLNDFFDSSCKDIKALDAIAQHYGLEVGQVKELFVQVCTINSIKRDGVEALERLADFLGESEVVENIPDDPISTALLEEAERLNRRKE